MELKQVIKVLAIVAILGGIARIGMAPSSYIWGLDSMPELVFGFIACIFMGIGIIGVYLHSLPRTGIVALLSVLLIAIGSMLTVALVWSNMLGIQTEDDPIIAPVLSANSIMTLLGQIVLGVILIRARIYPLWVMVLFMIYPAIYFIPAISNMGSVAWGLCYIVFGWYMLNDRRARA
ncbi:hypothetical protein B1748_07990 [Paenibacillus sp. MY03]|jgi:hypothetical protein|uniref:hypothetical protein n=1 Tax=Paenibacillus sp. MY03 TaxID=302980 RepID=UPI000B3CC757|nr:hypothetical protein [Paenibacillus sp. MY03]OUS77087.1 hypothetical protein B1748_07990 [Paenibacillus sp. MY03]